MQTGESCARRRPTYHARMPPSPAPEALDRLLRQTYLFAALDEPRLAVVRHGMRVLHLHEGQRLFDVGQPAERFFLVASGQIKLFRVSLDGNEKVIEIAGPGKTFAEAVMFMQRRDYPVSTAALTEARVCSFDNHTYLELLRASPSLCLSMLGEMSMRLHARLNEIDHLTLQNASFRVVHYLIDQLIEHGDGSGSIDLSTPKNIIASRVSIKPETFSRILRTLADEGIVRIDGKHIEVPDCRRLQQWGR